MKERPNCRKRVDMLCADHNYNGKNFVQIKSRYLMVFVQTIQKTLIKPIFVQRGFSYEI